MTTANTFKLSKRLLSTTSGSTFQKSAQPFTWDLGKYDESQIAQMQDMMTRVDEQDNIVGPISKLQGHLLQNGEAARRSELHRAFSLLLFNSKNELLLQQRAFKKITFPGRWTNTCCSHNAHVTHELEPEPHYIGMRRAAVRRTKFELGINDINAEEMKVVSRILYYAESCDRFAEHELDYIIFARKDIDPSFLVNPDEIEAIAWVKYHDFEDFLIE
jgi:isopentenyl-diphosphate Delta-isomerase